MPAIVICRRAHRTVVIGCFGGLSGALWGALVGSRAVSSLFFWALSLMNPRWAREVELQTPVWVVCSKPWCFTMFWAGSGCGGPAGWCWVVVPVARRVPQGGPPRVPGASLGLRCGPQRVPPVVLGVLWCPLGCLGGSRAVRVTVGLRMLSGLLLWLLRLPGFRGRSPRRHPKTAKGKSGPCCLFCSCLSLGLSLGLPGRVSVHLALCRSVALCRFLPLCPMF